MPLINRARHVRYTPAGLPVVRTLPSTVCKEAPPDFTDARHVKYTANAKPVLAWAWECCDDVGQEDVELTCWTLTPALRDVMIMHLFDVETCFSARGKVVKLHYNGTAWTGGVELRGGTLHLSVTCDPGEPEESLTKFLLTWSGCDSGTLPGAATCFNPIVINFGQATFDGCCECDSIAPDPITDTSPTIHFYGVTACKPTIFARHVGYTGARHPIVAHDRPCKDFDQTGARSCLDMTCPVVASVGRVLDAPQCDCMDGTYGLNYLGGVWTQSVLWPCGASGSISVTCADGGFDHAAGKRVVTLSVFVTCGATNTGGQSLDVYADDLEDLDVAFAVDMFDPDEDPPSCCNGRILVGIMR